VHFSFFNEHAQYGMFVLSQAVVRRSVPGNKHLQALG
jgi:hypothetical protein